MGHRIGFRAATTASLIALLLSGCATPGPTPGGSAVGTDTAVPVDSAPSTTEAPSTDDPRPSAACGTVFTPEEYARLADGGLVLDEDPFLLGPVMERMAASGALVCVWSAPNSDVASWYARLEVGDAGAAWIADLVAEGWLEDTERGDGTYLAPAGYDANYQPSVQLRDGVLHFASHNLVLESVLELQ